MSETSEEIGLNAEERSVLEQALELLGPHAAHPQTGRLHDPIYLLLSHGDLSQLDAIRESLLECAEHPAVPGLRKVLGYWEISPRPDLVSVLEAYGPVDPAVDPIDQVARLLDRSRQVEQVLQGRIADLEAQRTQLDRIANGMAAAGAMVAIFAFLGWLAALGAWDLPWSKVPKLERIEVEIPTENPEGLDEIDRP